MKIYFSKTKCIWIQLKYTVNIHVNFPEKAPSLRKCLTLFQGWSDTLVCFGSSSKNNLHFLLFYRLWLFISLRYCWKTYDKVNRNRESEEEFNLINWSLWLKDVGIKPFGSSIFRINTVVLNSITPCIFFVNLWITENK